MSKITLDNYPAFFLDHVEGKLDVLDEAELLLFLEQHPYLKAELDEFANIDIILEPVEESYLNKEGLKREIPEENLVWYVEGTLNARDKKIIDQEIAHNHVLAKEINLYKKTILKPELSIVFEDKESLKHKTRIIPIGMYYAIGIAASILLILGFFFLNSPDLPQNKFNANNLAIETNSSKPKTITLPAEVKNTNTSPISTKSVLVANKYKSKTKKIIAPIKKFDDNIVLPINSVIPNKVEEVKIVKQEMINSNPTLTNPLPNDHYFASNEEEENDVVLTKPENSPKPKGRNIWSRASNLLASLKSLGAKNVNATEEQISEDKTEYTFMVGKFEISKTY